ncbi:MAG TPA: class I SAM-dependent methyltransferase [Vicinamibacterales bacterium]|jgi:demethylmenaquinone methyltransferase/2-methoxy-6-polyprenyl-1,4-benzoquinol methylase|nr:class I SAM-dependent methyltransferase [Vicinamibacterales bacterium]
MTPRPLRETGPTPPVGRHRRGGPAGLRARISTPDGKRRYVRGLFATIADRYDFITRFLSYGQDQRWKRRLIRLADITPSDRVVDLACGTGDILFEAMRFRPARAVGLDLTHRMLVLANTQRPTSVARPIPRSSEVGASNEPGVESSTRKGLGVLVQGDMLALPFPANAFSVVTSGYGLRNVPDLAQSIREIRRVLVPGGRFLSLDFNRPSNALLRGAYHVYLTAVGAALGWALHGDPDTYRYIPESIRNYPGAAVVARMFEGEGFHDVKAIPVLFGLMAIHVARKT